MIKKIILTLTIAILSVAFLQATLNSYNIANAMEPALQLKWTNPMAVHDVAVSADGNYLAAVNNTGLHYFNADSSQALWHYQPLTGTLISVAISADGDYVVAGDTNGYLHYFNQSTQRTNSQTEPTWTSIDMGGAVERGTLDMSANGNYTVLGGTGTNIWYYADCIKRTDASNTYTWTTYVSQEFYTVHISANGKYVAGGGYAGGYGFVAFFKDADTLTGYPSYTWKAMNQLTDTITELALSDDGFAVAAIDMTYGTLYYWADAKNLSNDPNATWTNSGYFSCIDTSANGDTVVAGGYYLTSLHFWANARTREGPQTEDWINLTQSNVYDVAISKDGNIIATPTMEIPSTHLAYFFTADNTIIGNFTLLQFSNMVSMSADGTTTAMAGPGYDSLYLFKTTVDSTPPSINEVYQQPANDSVTPTDKVNIFANVTDDLSGVKQVTLNYTTGNGTWFTQTMDPYDTDIYNGTIQAFPYCTNVTYVIIAEDYANNTITTVELERTYKYHVIPEFTSTMLIMMLMAVTSLSVTAYRRRKP